MKDENKEETNQREVAETSDVIEKGVLFWTHPMLRNVSSDEKKLYLKSRGLTEEQIHDVWEKLVQEQDATTTTSATRNEVPPDNTAAAPQRYPAAASTVRDYPQQQSPLAATYNATAPYNVAQQEPSSTLSDIPILLTLGGALGLTAAATVRWLNGGDFCLLPPPTTTTTTTTMTQQQDDLVERDGATTTARSAQEDQDVNDDGELAEEPHNNNINSPQVEQLVETLERNCEKQERILQQLSNLSTKQVTDQSMSLLRAHEVKEQKNDDDNDLCAQLQEIKTELSAVSVALNEHGTNANATDWQERLDQSLQQLQECMKQIPHSQQQQDDSLALTSETAAAPPAETPCSSSNASLRDAIRTLAEENDAVQLREGAQLLYLYLVNLSSHPHVPRYRKIFTSNESFQKVAQLNGAKDLLLAVGFTKKDTCLEWQGGGGEEEMTSLKEAAAALSILKSTHDCTTANALSVLRPSTPPPPPPETTALPVLQTPHFIASPPNTKKHPLLTEENMSADSSGLLDISNASEHFESRLEALAQPVMFDETISSSDDAAVVPRTNLSMRSSSLDDEQDELMNGE